MADGKKEVKHAMIMASSSPAATAAAAEFKLNPNAPEFIPDRFIQMKTPNYFCQYLKFLNGSRGGMEPDCIHLGDQKPKNFVPELNVNAPNLNKNTTDRIQRIVKQVEYQFSDANLIANDFLVNIMNKDPEGYVPMSVIASWKKIKNLGVNNQILVEALRTSSQLVVSEDGKKVRRKKLFTEKDEEQMSRMVIVENLSEDSSRQHIEKLFSIVGSVKNIRICHPKEHNSTSPSKIDVIISNKFHAFVEFETSVQAAMAVEKLNDESNWRKGLRVRSLEKCMLRSVTKGKRYDNFDLNSEDDQSPLSKKLESPKTERVLQHNISENQNGARKACGRGRGKQTGLVQNYNGHGILSKTPQEAQKIGHGLCENNIKHAYPRPRMPDGTRGFTMGRGKPLNH